MNKLLHLTNKSIFFLLLVFYTSLANAAPPTTASSNFSFSVVSGTSISISFDKGNGDGRMIIIKKDAAVTYSPLNGGLYNASEIFGSGTQVKTGEYVVYNGSGNSVVITGLSANSTYHLAVFEYNGSGATTEFLNSPLRGTANTIISPTVAASNVIYPSFGGNYIRASFTTGNGAGRLVLMKKGAPVDAAPANQTNYSVNSQIGSGNIVVYTGTGNVFDVFNMTASTDYHFAVFEYNGAPQTLYQAIAPYRFNLTTNERPTVNSSNFVVDGRDGDRLSIRYTLGNGYGRIIVARAGQPVSALPIDGGAYNGNLSFGGSGSTNLGSGQFVIYNGRNSNDAGSNSMTLTGLPRNSTYYFAVYEYDMNAAGQPVFLTSSFASANGTTYDEPTAMATNVVIDNVSDKDAQVRYTAGNGTGRLLIARRGGPVNIAPSDLTNYSASINFGFGSNINGDNYVIADAVSNSTVQRLQSGTEYHFAVYEYNGYLGKLYLDANPARGQLVTAVRPTLAASAMSFSNVDGNSLKISWSNGNGKGRVIIAKKGSPVTITSGATGDLKDNFTYAADSVFAQGTQIKTGEFVIYNDSLGTVDTKNSVTVRGLEPNTQYYFAVYEYGQLNGVLQYATASPATPATLLVANAFTSRPPITAAGSLTINAVTNRTMNLSWISGSGEMRFVLAKAGSAVDATPENLMDYTAAAFGQGSEIGNGNFVVYKGKGSSFTLSGLQPGITYHFAEFEANGILAPVFQNTVITPATIGSKTTLEHPTAAPSGFSFTNVTSTGFTINWTKGNGAKTLVIMRAGTGVTAKPADGQVYTANSHFGSGTDISSDASKQYVVYNGNGTNVDITGLQPAEFYYVNVFTYEEPPVLGTAYLISQFASGFKQMIGAPLSQASALQATWIGGSTIKLDWTNGSGQRRIVLAKETTEVNGVPTDHTVYTSNSQFGIGQQIGSGNFIVYNGTGNTANISNLKPNKTYHFTAFEFNQFTTSSVYYLIANPGKAQLTIPNPLPVTWLSFTAANKPSGVLLEWKTTAETKNKEYQVERSTEGINFIKIGAIPASTQTLPEYTYSFVDRFAANGNVHYRIKQVDLDGNFSYSKVVQIKTANEISFQVIENPVRNELRLQCGAALIGTQISIVNSGGQIVYKGSINSLLTVITTSHLPAGVYYAKTFDANGPQATVSFLKQ